MKIVPRFTITDLLIATAGCAVILMLWLRIPVYEDWHWNYDLLPYKTPKLSTEFIDSERWARRAWTPPQDKESSVAQGVTALRTVTWRSQGGAC